MQQIQLQAMLPEASKIGSYQAEYKPCINEHIILSLGFTNDLTPVVARFCVVEVLHIAFNNSKIETWMQPMQSYNGKPAHILVTVEPIDDQARNHLKQLAQQKEQG